jgi:hypothetical protein
MEFENTPDLQHSKHRRVLQRSKLLWRMDIALVAVGGMEFDITADLQHNKPQRTTKSN